MRTKKTLISAAIIFMTAYILILTGCEKSSIVNRIEDPEYHLKPELGLPSVEAKTNVNNVKLAYLTFDDGPNSDFTVKVLDILAHKKAKATFMVVGNNVILNPDVLERIILDGHGVGNHTFSHDYDKIYSSPQSLLTDLEENNKVLNSFIGQPVKVFRAPGGPDRLNKNFIKVLDSHGYISVGWNVTSADTDPHGVSKEQVYQNIVSNLENIERMNLTPIILMHDGTQLTTTKAIPGSPLAKYVQNREATIGALPSVIDYIRLKGYTFAVLDEYTPPAWPVK